MTKKYYVISDVDKEAPMQPHSCEWPKLIAYSFDGSTVLIKEGRGFGLMGGEQSIDSIDLKVWGKIFSDAKAEWFKELIESGSLSIMTESSFVSELKKNAPIKVIEY